ncbi:hypothetical protein DSO57_1003048 [Entomophthora muscae]|uniref:Uncharacterized protein n=1 Tax=Entomophthora muscae TaxID=34485 RepID=A0ACC2TJ68_9FUNG|nr:hypothetical protein DSO57_1003048 [Entomophthora muscae]
MGLYLISEREPARLEAETMEICFFDAHLHAYFEAIIFALKVTTIDLNPSKKSKAVDGIPAQIRNLQVNFTPRSASLKGTKQIIPNQLAPVFTIHSINSKQS